MKYSKPFLFIFIIFFIININSVYAETINLPYTETSNISSFIMYDISNNNISVYSGNQIYTIDKKYNFKRDTLLSLEHGIYYNNITFKRNSINISIIEKFVISDAFLSKKVNYTLYIIENNEITSTKYNEYYVFSTTNNFAKTKITFIDDEINIIHKYTDIHGYNTLNYHLNIPNQIILTNCIFDNTIYITHYDIEYVFLGTKPKSYYIEQLSPILQFPYKIVSGWDNNNTILNTLIIVSYLFKIIFFWIKVIYQSFFVLLLIMLIGVIPFISYSQSTTPKSFINKLCDNYKKFFMNIFSFIKYILYLIFKIIESIPFI